MPSGKIKRGNRIGHRMDLYKEWQLSVDLKLERNQNTELANVFAILSQGSKIYFLNINFVMHYII